MNLSTLVHLCSLTDQICPSTPLPLGGGQVDMRPMDMPMNLHPLVTAERHHRNGGRAS
jgi:hypothetical protein